MCAVSDFSNGRFRRIVLKMSWFHSFKLLVKNGNIKTVRYLHSSFNKCYASLVNINENKNNALQKTTEDLSTMSSYLPETFNLAAYVNSSETLQNLLHLGVNLSKIEKKPHICNKILKLDFKKDIKNHIMFIRHFANADEIGNLLTKNPLLLCEDIEDLEVRINYLKSKHFKGEEISRIVTGNPFWLMFSTIRIDNRLGYFQEKFEFCATETRSLVIKQPRLITYNLHHVNTNLFVIKEEMGFEVDEIKELILNKPRLWMISQKSLRERFNYVHNVMKIPHNRILQYPNILLCRNFKIKQRHLFLEKLGRAQYDPTIEIYVPLNALVEGTDIEFCKWYAKCHVDDFNMFLKTL